MLFTISCALSSEVPASRRFDAQTGADREVQRILLELLNQLDGFDQSTSVKVWHMLIYTLHYIPVF